jgi:hypothetical protein
LVESLVKSALAASGGQTAAAGLIAAQVAKLTEGVLQAMFLTKLKIITAVLVAVSVAAAGTGTLAHHVLVASQPSDQPMSQTQPHSSNTEPPQPFLSYQGANEIQGQAENVRRISAPIVYEDLMLVLGNAEGAAAVIFTERIGRGKGYRFRYESKDGKKSFSGTGTVFEKYTDGRADDAGSQLFIQAGPLQVMWSDGSATRGWIYYSPETITVQIASANDFDDRVEIVLGKRRAFKKLDLRRFMK